MKTILTAIMGLLASLNPFVAAVFVAVSSFLAGITYLNSMWAGLFAQVASLVHETFPSVNFSPLGFLNYVVPLDTLLTLLTSYLSLLTVCAGIRILKSFVPTVA